MICTMLLASIIYIPGAVKFQIPIKGNFKECPQMLQINEVKAKDHTDEMTKRQQK